MKAAVGDRLVIKGHKVGEHDADAEILEVRGEDGAPPYLVRWSADGHEGLVFPGSDALIEHPAAKDPGDPLCVLEQRLAGWRAELEELRVKAELAEMEVRQQAEPLLESFESFLSMAAARVAELHDASRESIELLRTGVEEAVELVKEAAAEAAALLGKRD